MNKIELLAPAGDLLRLKIALIYGADAVYIGGKKFSLRYFASNFTLDDILEGVKFAHSLNKKVYVACNMVMHDEDAKDILEYLKALKNIEVDAIIVSSIYILQLAKSINLEAHMSTQLSLLNREAINFFYNLGASRVVLGRENDITEIKEIIDHTKAEIEVFIHGGMCSSYSGKCLLSSYMTERDPNRGGCAHSCRWKYHFYDKNNRQMFKDEEYLSISSKDLCLIKQIPTLIDAGVASLKIEGRMKSINYLAFIISAYRRCIDDYISGKPLDYQKYLSYIYYGEARETGVGFINGNVSTNEMLMSLNDQFFKAGEFIGVVTGYDEIRKIATLEVKNKIRANQKYVLLSPNKDLEIIEVGKMYFQNKEVEIYTVAKDEIEIEVSKPCKKYDIVHFFR